MPETPTSAPWSEVTQTLLYDPENEDVHGNCMQAAIACVLDLPLDAVPHFAQFLWWPAAIELWARGRDLTVKTETTDVIPERLCIVGGSSPRGVDHAVVGFGGEIVWDPHPSRAGLLSVKDVTWFEKWEHAGPKCWFCSSEWPVETEADDAA